MRFPRRHCPGNGQEPALCTEPAAPAKDHLQKTEAPVHYQGRTCRLFGYRRKKYSAKIALFDTAKRGVPPFGGNPGNCQEFLECILFVPYCSTRKQIYSLLTLKQNGTN